MASKYASDWPRQGACEEEKCPQVLRLRKWVPPQKHRVRAPLQPLPSTSRPMCWSSAQVRVRHALQPLHMPTSVQETPRRPLQAVQHQPRLAGCMAGRSGVRRQRQGGVLTILEQSPPIPCRKSIIIISSSSSSKPTAGRQTGPEKPPRAALSDITAITVVKPPLQPPLQPPLHAPLPRQEIPFPRATPTSRAHLLSEPHWLPASPIRLPPTFQLPALGRIDSDSRFLRVLRISV
ncbi:hypothetical protein B0T26DRAFT_749 [Lasiosphaeria miniovina]|uniref:Uncharacterized protein n=1 Tax=Lasiosphaeria miniovina TaxID=1954250 RepID=A0AA40BES1_9PEZI|nr:uncharacterized protein B0T26DRAFT_749 [Lasiosphaeria miniovina]KAK0732913.1 hypothetical protein B0T26DRAFT_749 [Lasiosphaeria miniovina]